MQISILGGIKHEDDSGIKQDNIYCWYQANGAINIGAVVALDESATTDYTGQQVIEADGDLPDHLCRGIYNWNCDTGKKGGVWQNLSELNAAGTAVATTGKTVSLCGYAAADGDWIGVQVYGAGPARILVVDVSPDVNMGRGIPLIPAAGSPTPGYLVVTTDPATPHRVLFTALRPCSFYDTEVGAEIDIACM